MYSSKIKNIIKRASGNSIGAIPVGLRVSFGGVKVLVEAQYEISGKVVVYLIGEGKNTIAKVDGSASNKTLAKSMLFEYVKNNSNQKFSKYSKSQNEKDKAAFYRDIKRMSSKLIDELYIEVNVANGKSKYAVSTNMAIKNKVAASRKSGYKKPAKKAAKKPVAKKKAAKKPVAKKKFVESGKKGSPIVYSKKNSSSGGLYCYKLKPRKK
tara:strand:+ start:60 stop:689 length:630 start_codon:yes stop_codon:yes gene_type:complete